MSTVKSYRTYNTDDVMRNLWLHLYRDLMCNTGYAGREDPRVAWIKDANIVKMRTYQVPARSQASPYMFKVEYQLESLFKRYRFQNDLYNEKDLESLTNAKYLSVQQEISEKLLLPRRESTFRVIQKARSIVKRVLGPYDEGITGLLCRFGTRATVGNTMAESYLDSKTSGLLTGSVEQHAWFATCTLRHDKLLRDIMSVCPRVITDTLAQVNVPKSYKTKRGIMPNTLIGSFRTAGLGKYIEIQLKRNTPIDIRYQSQKHGELAREGSIHRRLVTADLSAASHCFTDRHIRELVPRDWWHALNLGRVKYVSMDGKRYLMSSFMGMGIGYTFPLQTLLFYSILLAIKELVGCRGSLSVFGDDLIYPSHMHKYVTAIFNDFGFTLNADKTFKKDNFRESCGQDFFHGLAVRPFQPEGESTNLGSSKYLATLYKLHNGLCQRWDEKEIPLSLRYLQKEMLRVKDRLFQVPPDYPDYSGIRTSTYKEATMEWPWVKPWFSNAKMYVERLSFTPGRRCLTQLDIYAWDWLRSKNIARIFGIDEPIEGQGTSAPYVTGRPSITWVRIKRRAVARRGKGFLIPYTGRVSIPTVASKDARIARYITKHGELFYHRRP